MKAISPLLRACALSLALAPAHAASAAQTKTFYFYGGGTADATPQEILDQAHLFAELPIDGIAIRVQGRNAAGRELSVDYAMRTGEPWQFDFFAEQIPIVREIVTKPGLRQSLMDSFRILDTRMRWDDDAGWALFAHNFAVHAEVAKACGLKGMLIDCEDYHKIRQFFLADGDGGYGETAARARRRGRELFEGAFRAFPEMTLLSFWLLSLDPDYAETGDPVAWARRRMAEMAAKGTLVDLTATGEAVSRQAWGHYVWELGNVRPGEYYAVCAEGRGGGAADVLWTRLGKPDEKTAAVPWLGHRRQTLETAADGMRRAMDVVRIPDAGASRLQVLLPGLSTNALPKVKFKPSRLAIHRLTFAD